MTATAIGAVAAAVWLYLLAFRGQFWRVRTIVNAPAAIARNVVAVIPARDEAAVIGRALASLFAQHHAGSLHVVVVDDHSSDGTSDVARAAAAEAGCGQRLTVIAARPLPPGWTGKLWAMREGIETARSLAPDYLLLTDADIVHGPGEVAGLVARAEAGGYDLVSLMVRLNCANLWERLLIPAFVFFFFKLYPPRWVDDRRSRTAAAAGGCMLVRPAALARIGGIDSIRSEIIDDCALARRVKAGGAVWLGPSMGTHSIREYRSWRPIWDMVARCAFAQLRYSAVLLALMVVGMSALYLAPPLLLLSGIPAAMALGAAAWLAMAAAFVPILRLYRCPAATGFLLPLIAAFYMAATIGSAVMFWCGRGGSWKGRFQAASAG